MISHNGQPRGGLNFNEKPEVYFQRIKQRFEFAQAILYYACMATKFLAITRNNRRHAANCLCKYAAAIHVTA